ncbi:MAG: transposase [bacterium]|nr:transposase [bacterium]
MWFPTPGVKVYLGLGFTDMRKSIDSLSILVSSHLESDPSKRRSGADVVAK